MRNLLLLMACLVGFSAHAQLSCSSVNAAFSTSVSGGTVTLTNSSSPTATSNIFTNYTINWGDNAVTYAGTNASKTHTYNTSGTYTITLYSMVQDSINNITCYDTATSNVTVTTSLNCNNVNAQFYTYRVGNTGITLVNQSTPVGGPNLGVSYHISWGDSHTTNTSSKANQTHTYNSGGNYTVSMIVNVIDSNNNIWCADTTTRTVTIPGAGSLNCNSVNAAFATTSNLGLVTFYNYSTPNAGGGVSASYKIYWGDGSSITTSSKANRTHTYTSNGTYTVKLVATYNNSTTTCVDSTSDTVMINTTPPNVISGTIRLDSNTTQTRDTFKVWLITFNSSTNILTAVDSQIVSGYAYIPYAFTNKPAGNYRTKAHHLNGPSTGTGYVPTYHDSDLLWSNANVIAHGGTTTAGKNIYMKTGTVTTGPGFVGGNVSQGANKGTAGAIEGLNILLLDANGNVIAYDVTDVNGDYSFNSIPNGTYTVHPEQLAFNTTAATVNISNGSVSYTGINFERSEKNKTIMPKATSVAELNGNQVSFVMYPNPANNKVVLSWANDVNELADVTITDISGKKVYNTQVKMQGQSVIEFGELQTGFYMLNVSSDLGSNTHKLLIQH